MALASAPAFTILMVLSVLEVSTAKSCTKTCTLHTSHVGITWKADLSHVTFCTEMHFFREHWPVSPPSFTHRKISSFHSSRAVEAKALLGFKHFTT